MRFLPKNSVSSVTSCEEVPTGEPLHVTGVSVQVSVLKPETRPLTSLVKRRSNT